MGLGHSRDRHIRQVVNDELEAERLRREVNALKQDNNALRREMQRHLNSQVGGNRSANATDQKSEISGARIDQVVDEMLAHPETNFSMIPDMIERPALKSAMTYLLGSMAYGMDTALIQVWGHEFVGRWRPVQQPTARQPREPYSDYSEEDYSNRVDDD